jgi:anionic cell wall polymer biosynthesis LytR-Cps2A-Psr (LCP) family protein
MKQKKVVKKLFHIVLLVFVLFLFYKVNELNYTKQKSIKENIVNHPESLPTNEVAKATSF